MPPEDRDDDLDEESYVKADHRASREAGPAETEADAEGRESEPPEAEGPSEAEHELPDITVYSLLRMSIGMYIEQAWVHLGVRMDPNKNRVEQDLSCAKVAIDTVEFMARQLQPDLDEHERRELDLVLANLRMNFVQRA